MNRLKKLGGKLAFAAAAAAIVSGPIVLAQSGGSGSGSCRKHTCQDTDGGITYTWCCDGPCDIGCGGVVWIGNNLWSTCLQQTGAPPNCP